MHSLTAIVKFLIRQHFYVGVREEIRSFSKLDPFLRWGGEPGNKAFLDLPNTIGRKWLSTLRSGTPLLEIERGRHEGMERCLRRCPICGMGVESVEHFLLTCEGYDPIRKELYEQIEKVIDGLHIPGLMEHWRANAGFYMFGSSNFNQINKIVTDGIARMYRHRNKILDLKNPLPLWGGYCFLN